jgi:hypothetical protein
MARRVAACGKFITTGARFSARAASILATRPNELTFDSGTSAVTAFYPTPDNKYVGGWYHLEPEEALVVEGLPPDARYWSLLLMSRWMESLDTRRYRTSINKSEIVLEDDGSFRIFVASRDPGEVNWLDTEGHADGYVMFRWMQAERVDKPTFRTITLSPH